MLEVKGLKKTFLKGTMNEHVALDGIDLCLKEGEFVTVIGSNGAGKSTLFNAIAGNFDVDCGHIWLDGQDVTYLRETKRAKLIARIFQQPLKGTAPDLTVEENLALAYARSNQHLLSRAISKKTEKLLRDRVAMLGMGLEDRMKTKIGLLSGGQRQAISLLMSTITAPKVLLLDEHTAALDPVTADRILSITQSIVRSEKIATLMITHNISSALSLGTRTIMMERGKIVLDLKGEERDQLNVESLMQMYKEKCNQILDNDRMLLS